ncbi:modification methylase [bacterium]|nr:modification methylase [bacterium]
MSMQSLNYIGSKRTLIDFIKTSILSSVASPENLTFCDIFSGTGIVGFSLAEHFHRVVSNDMEYYSFCINNALLDCAYTDNLKTKIDALNRLAEDQKNTGQQLVVKEYTEPRLFFTTDNARRIDVIRAEIDNMHAKEEISKPEYYFLIASLLVCCDKVANTTSVYGAFLKKFKASAEKKLILTPIHTRNCRINCTVFNQNAVDVSFNSMDVVYLDPPYNHRQYGANYSPLNYIALYDPNVKVMNKTGLMEGYNKSDFCKKTNIKNTYNELLNKLVSNNAKYIFISYNNEGILDSNDMQELLNKFGKVELKSIEYKKYKSSKDDNKHTVKELLWCLYI